MVAPRPRPGNENRTIPGMVRPRKLRRAAVAAAGSDGGLPVSPPESTPTRKIGIRDVARQADVSVATVSMVINANPKISRPTAVRVQRVMEQMGYQPNRLAQSLSSKYTRVLAAMLPPLKHPFADAYFGELLSGICDRAARLGHKIMLEHAKPDFIREGKHIELFERRYVDGVLLLGFHDRHHFLADLAAQAYPAISVNNRFEAWDMDHVVCDYESGAEQVMAILLQLGHRKIGLITGAAEAQTTRQVCEVYARRCQHAGLALDDSWRADGRFTEEGGADAAGELLARHPDMTAVFAGNDKMALGAMSRLQHDGRRVPEDVSIVGFDDIHHTAYVNPALTTVHLPLYECGARACERLIDRIRGKTDRISEVLPTHLVLRESTAMARQV